MRRPSRRPVSAWIAIVVIVAAGCAGERPSATDWRRTWEMARDRMPSADGLLAGGRDLCDDLVGELRETRDRLEPAPTEALDAAVDGWLDHAESIAFDCPHDPARLSAEYAELDALAAEIDAVVVTDA